MLRVVLYANRVCNGNITQPQNSFSCGGFEGSPIHRNLLKISSLHTHPLLCSRLASVIEGISQCRRDAHVMNLVESPCAQYKGSINSPGRVSLDTVSARMEEFVGYIWWTPHGRGTGLVAGPRSYVNFSTSRLSRLSRKLTSSLPHIPKSRS